MLKRVFRTAGLPASGTGFGFVLLALCVLLAPALSAEASPVRRWQSEGFDSLSLRKIFLAPLSCDLRAGGGDSLAPEGWNEARMSDFLAQEIRSAMKGAAPVVKDWAAMEKDTAFVYGPAEGRDGAVLERAADMGFQAMVKADVAQSFRTEHVPERTVTRTVYREVQILDGKGRVKETVRIPEEKTEVRPAYDVTWLDTLCRLRVVPAPFSGDHSAAAEFHTERAYQGGPVKKVVEKGLREAAKALFAPQKGKSGGR